MGIAVGTGEEAKLIMNKQCVMFFILKDSGDMLSWIMGSLRAF